VFIGLAYIRWKNGTRRELPNWRNGLSVASMAIVAILWIVQTTRWILLSNRIDIVPYGADWAEFHTFLPAYYAFPGGAFAFALKGVPRLQMIAAWLMLALFYGAFVYD
jgi:hypothetical protein